MSGKPMKKASGKGTRRSSIARGMSAIAGSSPRVRRGSVEAKLVRAPTLPTLGAHSRYLRAQRWGSGPAG
jgi:hypothetical protein|eukprot:COSAG06_NODE_10271_length_1714_cov_1.956656_2_plen_70_part_00